MSMTLRDTELVARELIAIRRRTRRFFYVSVTAHALLFVGTLFYRAVRPAEPRLVEITWLAPEATAGSLVPVAATPPPQAEKSRSFVRETERSDIAPLDQHPDALADRMVQRLSQIEEETNQRAPVSMLVDKHERPALQLPGIPGVSDAQARPAELVRGGERTEPVPLPRSERKQAPAPVLTRLPEEKPEPPKPKRIPKAEAKREIAGASLIGPVADRRLLSYETPSYPEKARREAIEGSVKLYFTVLPDGRVKENIMIEKTSGIDGFDRNAVAALRAWRFEPMKSGATGEQWGSITFHYRLSDRT